MDRSLLAAMVDHTLVDVTATASEVRAACAEAVELGARAVCVPASLLPLSEDRTAASIPIVAVVGEPSTDDRSSTKAEAAASAVENGATEIDVVILLAAAAAGDWSAVEADLAEVRAAVPPPVALTAVLESAGLARATAVVAACSAAEAAGADLVATSAGFEPGGGATVESVATLSACLAPRLGVKASGVETAAGALAMVEAGATRLGCSATRSVLDGLASYDRPTNPA